jgi:hypothetical protein
MAINVPDLAGASTSGTVAQMTNWQQTSELLWITHFSAEKESRRSQLYRHYRGVPPNERGDLQ